MHSKFSLFFTFLLLSFFSKAQYYEAPEIVCLSSTRTIQLKAGGGTQFLWKGPNGFLSSEKSPIITNASLSNAGEYQLLIDEKYPFTFNIKVLPDRGFQLYSNYDSKKDFYIYTSFYSTGDLIEFSGPKNFYSNLKNPKISNADSSNSGVYKAKVTDSYGCVYERSTNVVINENSITKVPYYEVNTDTKSITKNKLLNWDKATLPQDNLNICNKSNLRVSVDSTLKYDKNIIWYLDDKVIDNPYFGLNITKKGTYKAEVSFNNRVYYTPNFIISFFESITPFLYAQSVNVIRDTIFYCQDIKEFPVKIQDYSNSVGFGRGERFDVFKDRKILFEDITNSYFFIKEEGTYSVVERMEGCFGVSREYVVKKTKKSHILYGSYEIPISNNIKACSTLFPNGFNIRASFSGSLKLKLNDSLLVNGLDYVEYNIKKSGAYTFESDYLGCNTIDTINVDFGKYQSLGISESPYSAGCDVNNSSMYTYPPNSSLTGKFTWYNANQPQLEIYSNKSNYFTPQTPGSYIVKLQTESCSGESPPKKTQYPQNVTFKINLPNKKEICEGLGQLMLVEGCIPKSTVMNWYRNGEYIESNEACAFTATREGIYTARRNFCTVSTNSVEITLSKPNKLEVLEDCSLPNSTSIYVQNNGYSAIKWQLNNLELNAANNSFKIPNPEAGTYSATVSKGSCTWKVPAKEIGINKINSRFICRNETANFDVLSSSQNTKWYFNEKLIASGNKLSIEKFSNSNNGNYTVKLNSIAGCFYEKNFQLQIRDKSDFSIAKELNICKNENLNNYFTNALLTDSTEITQSYFEIKLAAYDINGYSSIYDPFLVQFPGNYTITNYGYLYRSDFPTFLRDQQCSSEIKTTKITLIENCGKITIPDISKMVYCKGENFEFPFYVSGTNQSSTVYSLQLFQPVSLAVNAIQPFYTVNAKNGMFVIPKEIINKIGDYFDFKIVSDNKSIATYFKNNINATLFKKKIDTRVEEFGNQKAFSINQTYANIITDSIYFYKNGKLALSTTKLSNWFYEVGEYEVFANFKYAENSDFLPKMNCLEKISTFSISENPKYTVKLTSSDYYFCRQGYEILILAGSFEQSNTQIKWFKDGVLINTEIFEASLKIDQEGIYHAQLIIQNDTISTEKYTFKKNNRSLGIDFTINGQTFSMDPNTTNFNLCSASSNYLSFINTYYKNFDFNIDSLNLVTYEDGKFKSSERVSPQDKVLIENSGDYQFQLQSNYCNVSSPKVTISVSETITDPNQTEISICKNFTYYKYFNAERLIGKSADISVSSLQVLKDNSVYKTVNESLSYFTERLSEPGVYVLKSDLKFKNGKSCTFFTDKLKLNFSDTISIPNLAPSYQTCSSPFVLNQFSEIFKYSFDQYISRSFGYFFEKNGTPVPIPNISETYSINEPGKYKIALKTKEGCKITSNEFEVSFEHIKATLAPINAARSCKSLYAVTLDNKKYLYEVFKVGVFKENKLLFETTLNTPFELVNDGSYYAIVSSQTCSESTNSIKIDNSNKIGISVPEVADICNGQPFTVSLVNASNSINSYIYNNKEYPLKSDKFTIDKAGNYSFISKTENCLVSSPYLQVDDIKLSNKLVNQIDSIKCGNHSILFVGDENRMPYTMNLFLNEKFVASTTKNNLLYGADSNDEGIYQVIFEKKTCKVASEKINVRNKFNSNITAQGIGFCTGKSTELSVVSVPGLTYEWYYKETLNENFEFDKIENSSKLAVNKTGYYKARLIGQGCDVFSNTIYMEEIPVLLAFMSGDTIINYGENANLYFVFTSVPPFNVELSNGLSFISESDSLKYSFSPLKSEDIFFKKISNKCGEGEFGGSAKIKVLVLGKETTSNIKVFPNPTTSYLTIGGLDSETSVSYKATLFDVNGGVLKTIKLTSAESEPKINVSDLKMGIYFLKIENSESYSTFKIIKH